MKGKDPVRIIRDVVANELVFYYPFAGRLREYATRKLMVECTGEGVVFVEADADADVTLQHLGTLLPPIPNLQELLHDVPGTAGVINCPLMLIQVRTHFGSAGHTLSMWWIHHGIPLQSHHE